MPLVQNGSYQPEGRGEAGGGLQGGDHGLPAVDAAGHGHPAASAVDPGERDRERCLPMNAGPERRARGSGRRRCTAVADAGKGPVWVSSQLFTLEVAAPLVTLAMERPAVEQGKTTQLFCKVAVATPFEGKAKVKMLGLPAKVTTHGPGADQGHEGTRVPDRRGQDEPGRQARRHLLPGGDRAERRTDHRQHRRHGAADRRAAAAEGGRGRDAEAHTRDAHAAEPPAGRPRSG